MVVESWEGTASTISSARTNMHGRTHARTYLSTSDGRASAASASPAVAEASQELILLRPARSTQNTSQTTNKLSVQRFPLLRDVCCLLYSWLTPLVPFLHPPLPPTWLCSVYRFCLPDMPRFVSSWQELTSTTDMTNQLNQKVKQFRKQI